MGIYGKVTFSLFQCCKFMVAFKLTNYTSQNTKQNNKIKKKNVDFHFTSKPLQRCFYKIIWIISYTYLNHLSNVLPSLITLMRYLYSLELFLLPLMSNPWLISKLTKLSLTVAENVYKNFDDPQSPLKALQYLR